MSEVGGHGCLSLSRFRWSRSGTYTDAHGFFLGFSIMLIISTVDVWIWAGTAGYGAPIKQSDNCGLFVDCRSSIMDTALLGY